MNKPKYPLPESKNWADYCDDLRNEPFTLGPKPLKPLRIPAHLPDPLAALAAKRKIDAAIVLDRFPDRKKHCRSLINDAFDPHLSSVALDDLLHCR